MFELVTLPLVLAGHRDVTHVRSALSLVLRPSHVYEFVEKFRAPNIKKKIAPTKILSAHLPHRLILKWDIARKIATSETGLWLPWLDCRLHVVQQYCFSFLNFFFVESIFFSLTFNQSWSFSCESSHSASILALRKEWFAKESFMNWHLEQPN